MVIEKFKNNIVLNLSFEFSISIIKYCNELHTNKQFVLANQLLKSGTSIGANIMEAQNSESRADFIHKIKIAAKEADETQYWLMLCQAFEGSSLIIKLLSDLEAIQKIISRILATTIQKN